MHVEEGTTRYSGGTESLSIWKALLLFIRGGKAGKVMMLFVAASAVVVLALMAPAVVDGFAPRLPRLVGGRVNTKHLFLAPEERPQRRVIGKDNLGEPIYEGEDRNQGEKLDVLGIKLNVDPVSASLLVFLVIAFQFFVVANL